MSNAQYDPSKVTIHPGVRLGRDVVIHDFCIIGLPPRGAKPGERETIIGDGAVVRPFTTIYSGVTIGKNFQSGQGLMIREENVIGDDTSIGTNCLIEIGNRIGSHVRIHGGAGLEHATIEDHVILGPYVVTVTDPHPSCPRYRECLGGATVRRYARIGAMVVLSPGVTVGRNCLVGSGTQVTRDVPDNSVVVGRRGGRVAKRIEELECFKGFYPRAYAWDPPEMFDASLFPKPKA